MIKDLIQDIVAAEKEAAEIVNNAYTAAKEGVACADKQAVEIKEQALRTAKTERQDKLAKAEADAQAEYENAMNQGGKEAANAVSSVDISSAVKLIKTRLLERYGSR